MGHRQRRRQAAKVPVETTDYVDAEGNVLTLRNQVSVGTVAALAEQGSAATSTEDAWQRRAELLFERFVVRWTIAGLPLERQKDLLGRYRMADSATREWVRRTLTEHVRRQQPELVEP